MLELKDISKNYPVGKNVIHALKGVSLKFRRNEFVSILGPSGCGKTTLLNIVGGLDRATEGELVINGRTTGGFKPRDWDAYRNHSIGFVFQSYNLIPHQTVLQNVELALTLSGVSKTERRERAIKALEEVGLGDQLKKRPNEISGGQMQRVAIARALVNDPDIILADEPTGALDTETSVQVMEILKRISERKLIIMVTHNPELADRYSSRLIRMLDGRITDDSSPLSGEEISTEQAVDLTRADEGRRKRPSMSVAAACSLSLRNLMTKKGRTVLTSFAGSIGIIGIALILSLSAGVTSYIKAEQERSLAGYPLYIEPESIDYSAMFKSEFDDEPEQKKEHDKNAVYNYPMLNNSYLGAGFMDYVKENDLGSFKKFIENERADENSELYKAISAVQYSYDINVSLYSHDPDGRIIMSDPVALISDIMDEPGADSIGKTPAGFLGRIDIATEILPGKNGEAVNDVVKDSYELLYGQWPQEYNEMILIVDENNEIGDVVLYSLGLETRENMKAAIESASDKDSSAGQRSWSYEEICQKQYRLIPEYDCYSPDEKGVYADIRSTDTGLKYLYDNALDIRISGIVRSKGRANGGMISTPLGYTYGLSEYLIADSEQAAAVKAQLDDPDTDIFTGLPFESSGEPISSAQKAESFKEYAEAAGNDEKARLYISMMSTPSDDEAAELLGQLSSAGEDELLAAFAELIGEEVTMDEQMIKTYIAAMPQEEYEAMLESAVYMKLTRQKEQKLSEQLKSLTAAEINDLLNDAIESCDESALAAYSDELMPRLQSSSESTYEENLERVGYIKPEPSGIYIYSSSFEDKDIISGAINKYNDSVPDEQKIAYNDFFSEMLESVTRMINSVTYVLISLVGISLVVSSIMIGVITLISVQERTKEIGILRAMGASRKDVSRLFNAETMIIGFTSGLFGAAVTYLLCIPMNILIHMFADAEGMNAFLPPAAAVILTLISVLLTLFSGLIPSRSAAKKDPVVALRTE